MTETLQFYTHVDLKKEDLTTQRKSNFELLRIITMLMIIMHHYCVHTNFFKDVQINNTTFNLILTRILTFGKLGNHIFIIMTGYFMIKSKMNYKKIILLILEMIFYSVVITGISFGFNIAEFNLKTLIKSFLPIIWGNWFLIYYIILYLLIPYINLFMEKINKKTARNLVVTLLLFYCIIPTFTKNSWNLDTLHIFILDYLIGVYIRLYPIKKLESNKFNVKALLIISLLGVMSVLGFVILGEVLNINININSLIEKSNYLFGAYDYTILLLLMAILIFSIFKNMNIKSKIINYISSSTLGVYLIHDNPIIRTWLWQKFWPGVNFINSNLFILHIVAKVLLIFIVCVIIDKIRIMLFHKWENKLSDKIYNIIIKIKNKIVQKYNSVEVGT